MYGTNNGSVFLKASMYAILNIPVLFISGFIALLLVYIAAPPVANKPQKINRLKAGAVQFIISTIFFWKLILAICLGNVTLGRWRSHLTFYPGEGYMFYVIFAVLGLLFVFSLILYRQGRLLEVFE